MARAGSGGSRGSRSSGSRSSSRSSGGHRSSSSRARSSSSSRSYSSSRSSRSYSSSRSSSSYRPSSTSINIGSNNRSYSYGGSYKYGNSSYGSSYGDVSGYLGAMGTVLAWVIIIAIVGTLLVSLTTSGTSVTKSSYARERIEGNYAFDSNCVVDEISWFDNTYTTGTRLKYFYEKTGVQPMVLFRAYDSALVSDADKEDWANQYYEENIEDENTFLYVYFAEEDTDNDVGYMCYVNGYSVNGMMDAEAVNIFWDYIDKYWYTDLSTDDVIVNAFTETADRITTKSKTAGDIGYLVALLAVIIGAAIAIIKVVKAKRKAEAEKAAETERILKTDISELAKSTTEEDLVNKYK